MKRYLFAMLYLCCISSPAFCSVNDASLPDIAALSGAGTLNNVDVFRIDGSGNVLVSSTSARNSAHTTITNQGNLISSGTHTLNGNVTIVGPADLYFGKATVSASSTTTSGNSQGTIFTGTLLAGSAAAAVEGSAICSTNTASGGALSFVVCGGTAQLGTFVGVAAVAASTGAVVNIYSAGSWALAFTTGTVNAGDLLGTSSASAGALSVILTASGGTPSVSISSGVVAVALSAGPSAGGTTFVRLK